MRLFRAIELPSDEPVQYVGVYVLKWGTVSQPSLGFVEIDENALVEFADLLRQYPNEAVSNLLALALDER